MPQFTQVVFNTQEGDYPNSVLTIKQECCLRQIVPPHSIPATFRMLTFYAKIKLLSAVLT